MRRSFLALFASALLACSSGSSTDAGHGADAGSDTGPQDATTADAPVSDVATTDTAVDQVSVDAPADTAQRDAVASDAPADAARVCPVSCTNSDECAAACPVPGAGAYCCVLGQCALSPTTCPAPPNDAGACTGTNQCDATHRCLGDTHCCAPLPGEPGCGFCSVGACPG